MRRDSPEHSSDEWLHAKDDRARIYDRVKIADVSVKGSSITSSERRARKTTRPNSARGFFAIGTKAKDKNDYVIFDKAKGVLLYVADGSGNGRAVEIATLSKKLKMIPKDFFVV